MKNTELKFKCVLSSTSELGKLKAKLRDNGFKATVASTSDGPLYVYATAGEYSPWALAEFESWNVPKVSFGEAMQMIDEVVILRRSQAKFDIKPFDKILTRDNDMDVWRAGIYSHIDIPHSMFISTWVMKQLLPYESHTGMLGTVTPAIDCWRLRDGVPYWGRN